MNASSTYNLLLTEKNKLILQNYALITQIRHYKEQIRILELKVTDLQVLEVETTQLRRDNMQLQEELFAKMSDIGKQMKVLENDWKIKLAKQKELYEAQIREIKADRELLLQRMFENDAFSKNSLHYPHHQNNLESQAQKLLEIGQKIEQTISQRGSKIGSELPMISEAIDKGQVQLDSILQTSTLQSNKSFEDKYMQQQNYNTTSTKFRQTHLKALNKNHFMQRSLRSNKSQDVKSMPHLPNPIVISLKRKLQ